jgi:hypothetical protein
MTGQELKHLLDLLEDTKEIVLRREASLGPAWTALYDAWSDAHEEADSALQAWRRSRDGRDYALYRAAQDREDAAQDALAAAAGAG